MKANYRRACLPYRVVVICSLIMFAANFTVSCQSNPDPWEALPAILAQIKAPTFADKDFLLTDFGAIGDGVTDCTEAFEKAIEACRLAGGGRVVVPAGKYHTGAIHLKSNVNLHITKEATVLFSQDTKKYLPQVLTRFESVELMNYSPFIYAYEQENIAITGEGILDGQGDAQHWWYWKGKWEDSERMGVKWEKGMPSQFEANERLKKMAADNVPVAQRIFGEGDYLRANFVQPYKCKNVLIEGVTLKNSPMWVINPVLSTNVTVRGIKVDSHGPNNDGCNPESSQFVLIEKSFFDTGDDCIAIKSGRDHDGRRINMPSENIVVRNCVMKDGHGGVVIGSEISGNVKNVFAENCEMSSPHLDRALRIKSNSLRGGVVENIFMRNITVGDVADAVVRINMFYANETGNYNPTVRNVQVRNITSKKSVYALRIESDEAYPIEGIVIEDSSFDNVAKGNLVKGVKSLTMKNVKINGKDQ